MGRGKWRRECRYGWSGWSPVSGVMRDRRTAARVRGKVCKLVMRPAVMYGQEAQMEEAPGWAGLEMSSSEGALRFSGLEATFREARLRWFGRAHRRDSGYAGQRILKMGTARRDEKRKTSAKIHSRREGGRRECESERCERGGCCGQGEVEANDSL